MTLSRRIQLRLRAVLLGLRGALRGHQGDACQPLAGTAMAVGAQ
jgi:hypothetical protein